ncbi:MAG: hypothetical protein PHE83_05735 [Opitutaceae bacterium]|nr:hypothetical protein [Opitutaceae bacterium]
MTITPLSPQISGQFRNIHFAPPEAVAPEQPPAPAAPSAPVASFEGRLRWVTRSPADEFAARAGAVEPLAGEIAALILFRKEKLTCGRDGLAIKIKTDGDGREVTRKYWHENARTCQPDMLGKEVFVAYNRHEPACVYVFTGEGEFVEAVPEKGTDDFFGAAKELEAHRRHQTKVLARLEYLHAGDTQEAVASARDATAQMVKVVQTFPQEAPQRRTPQPLALDQFASARAIAVHEEVLRGRRADAAEADPSTLLSRRAARAEALSSSQP